MGLAVADALQSEGWQVTVFEADDRIGGMSAMFDFDGLRIERYYHFICKTDAPLLALIEALGLTSRLRWRTTRMGFFYDGAMYEWGRPDALLRFPHLGRREKLRYALHVLRARSMGDWRTLDGVEATEWIRSWVGDHAYELLWRKSFELKFYEYQQSISAAWIATRMRRVALSRKNAFHEQMGYLEGGSEALLDALAARLGARGGSIRLRSPVESVLSGDGRVTGVLSRGKTHTAELVVSTVPLQFVPALAPSLSRQELARVAAIQNIGVVCVKFKLSEQFTPYFWINVNDPRIQVPGIIEYTNLNPIGSHVVYVPYYLPAAHTRWDWDHDTFAADATECLKRMRPEWNPATIEATHVSRYRYAQPICGPGFADKLPSMQTSISGFLMADTSHCYPEDRSISESLRIAEELVRLTGSPR